MSGLGWPDVLIGVVVLIGMLMGFARGFVSALSGVVAVAVAVFAAFHYTGGWDAPIAAVTRLGPGSAHVIGMALFSIAAYAITVAAGVVLSRFARLPGIGLVNGVLGAGVGALVSVALLWFALYVALFFPLPRDLREDLHRSSLVVALAQPNAQVDDMLRAMLPMIARPFAMGFFDRHRL